MTAAAARPAVRRPRFCRIPSDLLPILARFGLSGRALQVLLRLLDDLMGPDVSAWREGVRLTTADAAHWLGKGKTTAWKALQEMVDRGVLVRRGDPEPRYGYRYNLAHPTRWHWGEDPPSALLAGLRDVLPPRMLAEWDAPLLVHAPGAAAVAEPTHDGVNPAGARPEQPRVPPGVNDRILPGGDTRARSFAGIESGIEDQSGEGAEDEQVDLWFGFVQGKRQRMVDHAAWHLDRVRPGWEGQRLDEPRAVPEPIVQAVAALLDPRKWHHPMLVARRLVARAWWLRRQARQPSGSPAAVGPEPTPHAAPPKALSRDAKQPPVDNGRADLSNETARLLLLEADDRRFREIHGRSRTADEVPPELRQLKLRVQGRRGIDPDEERGRDGADAGPPTEEQSAPGPVGRTETVPAADPVGPPGEVSQSPSTPSVPSGTLRSAGHRHPRGGT